MTKWSATGKRLGYSLVLLAMIAFGIGFATNFGDVIVAVVVGSLALSAVALVPAIIFGYGVKAAEREERGEPSRH